MTDSTIREPGVYQGIPNEVYHGQLTPTPSLSAGMAVELMETCPAAVWNDCYLNPDYEREQKREFDLGTAGHLALLEPDEWNSRVVVIDADSYKTALARTARDEAYKAGKTPLLTKHVDAVMGMRNAVMARPRVGKAFLGGKSEQTLVWRDRKTGVWLKCRPDKAPDDWSWIADVKTTTSVNPRALRKKAHDGGWAQRADWYLDGVEAVTGRRPEHFYFIAVEVKPPHLVKVCRYRPLLGEPPKALQWAKKMNRRAIDTFAACVAANEWPDYGEDVLDLDLPTYAEYQLEERDAEGDFKPLKPTAALLRTAMDFQKPINRGA